jgi:mevalonate kinase
LIRLRLRRSGQAPACAKGGVESPPADWADCVNRWAFAAEVLLHGSPSGLDNTVSCVGSAVQYRRPGGFSRVEGFPRLDVLLTNTKVPRETKALVAGVRSLLDRHPDVVGSILDSMEAVTNEFLARVSGEAKAAEGGAPALLEATGRLMGMAHGLLNSIGVGHPQLDAVCRETGSRGFASKLTGAGEEDDGAMIVPSL